MGRELWAARSTRVAPRPTPHTRGLILSASDGIWNMLFSTCSHTSRWVRIRFGGCVSPVVAQASAICSNRLHRSPNSPFAFSRLANLTHAVAARLRLSVPNWQHVHRRVLRELGIEFEPTRHWSSSFFTCLQPSWKLPVLCNRHRPSEADIATGSHVEPGRDSCALGSRKAPSMRRRPIECTLMGDRNAAQHAAIMEARGDLQSPHAV